MTIEIKDKTRYRAFVSYSHSDSVWGKWLHSALESYRPPRGVVEARSRIRPLFLDESDAAASPDLGATIKDALSRSDALIVICSPNSAKSTWVDKEIVEFRALGGADRTFGLIVDGKPHGEDDNCFPPSFAGANGAVEPLAVDLRAHGRRDSLLKLAAALLGIEFDRLKRRDRQRMIRRTVLGFTLLVGILSLYGISLLLQTRAVNQQTSAVLSALALQYSDDGAHGRALRYAIASARSSLLFPPASEAEPNLARAAYFSTLPAELHGHTASIYSVSFDAEGSRLASGSQDHTVRLWNRSDDGSWTAGEIVDTGSEIASARFAENGHALAVHSLFGEIRVWRQDQSNWTSESPFGEDAGRVRAFDISSDGDIAIVGRESSVTEIWRFDGTSWGLEFSHSREEHIPTAAAIAHDGTVAIVGFLDGTLQILEQDKANKWNVSAELPLILDTEVRRLALSGSGLRFLAISIGDLRIISRSDEGAWVAAGRVDADRNVTSAAFLSPNGDILATNASSGAAVLWIEQGNSSWKQVSQFGDDADISRSIAASMGGPFATGSNNDAVVRIWQPGSARSWRSYAKVKVGLGLITNVDAWVNAHTGFLANVVYSQNGRRKAESDVYGVVRIFDTETGIEVASIDASETPRFNIDFVENDTILRVLPESGSSRYFPVSKQVALSDQALLDAVCSEQMPGSLSILTEADVAAAPVLRGRVGESVCNPQPFWARPLEALQFAFDTNWSAATSARLSPAYP